MSIRTNEREEYRSTALETGMFSDVLVFYDDNNRKKNIPGALLEKNASTITFLTSQGSTITIPIARLIKLKQRNIQGDSTDSERSIGSSHS